MTDLDIGVYVPQMGFSFSDVLHRAQRCERLGIGSLWLYDHMYGPGVPNIASLEAWTLATALLSRTDRLRVGHMVLCNQFRHPAVLAKMATTLDQISDGRLALGIGSGSIEDEHLRMGLPWGSFRERSERLGETLEILTQAFAAEAVDFEGRHYAVRDMPIVPGPVQRPRPPIVVGGVGEKFTLPLVARYADVWNVPTYALGELEHKVTVLRVDLRGHRPRPRGDRAVGGGRDGAGPRPGGDCPRSARSPNGGSAAPVSGFAKAGWSARHRRSWTASRSGSRSGSVRSCCSPTTVRPTRRSTCWPRR